MKKICTKCKKEKKYSDFYKDKNKKSGLTSACKICRKIYKQTKKYKEYAKKYEKREYVKNKKKKYWKSDRYKLIQNERRKTIEYKEYHKKYEQRKKRKKAKSIYRKKRYKKDIQWKIAQLLRNRLVRILKNKNYNGSAVRDLGCTVPELKIYLEKKFQDGMTWDNWTTDGWHIDHIIPLAKFNLIKKDQFLKAVNYKNLQPLWAVENLSKNKY